jgi:hypothetical protein
MARDARQLLQRKATSPGRVFGVAVRVAAAVAAGYFLAHAFSVLAAAALPFARPDRVVAGGMLALVVWAVAAVYAFAARSAWRAAGVPLALALAMLGLAGLLGEQALRP